MDHHGEIQYLSVPLSHSVTFLEHSECLNVSFLTLSELSECLNVSFLTLSELGALSGLLSGKRSLG